MDNAIESTTSWQDAICRSCAACCRWPGHVLLTAEDITRLADFLSVNETEFIQQYTVLARNRAQLSLAEAKDGACIFLAGNECKVYPARPQQCRDFPWRWQTSGCPLVQRSEAPEE